MKKTILISLLFITLATNNTYAQYFPVDTAILNSAYRELANNPNTLERQKKFFDAFPNTWMEFIMTYQFVPNGDYDLTMYWLAEQHVKALEERVILISDSIYCKKLVNIAVGGKWGGDAPGALKSLLHQVMWRRMDGMLQAVSTLRKGHQMQFWQFYWSNIVKNERLETEYNRLYKLNADVYPEQMKIMSIAFEYFYDGITIPDDFREKIPIKYSWDK